MKNNQSKTHQYPNHQPQNMSQLFRQAKGQSIFQQQTAPSSRELIHSKLLQMNDIKLPHILKKRDYHKALSLLSQLEQQINVQYQQNSFQAHHNQSSRTDKLLYYHQLSVCHFNYASIYQKVNNDEQTAHYFQKALKNFQYMQGYITNRQESVSHSIQLAKMRIQYCSILSQNGKHQEAITFAEKALQKIIESFRILEAICFQIIVASRLPETNSNSRDSRTKIQLVNFKTQVLYQAEKLLKQLSSLPQAHELTSQFKKKYESLMQKMFFWKDNAENNQKVLRKQLQSQRKQINSERNILGVQKNSLFNDNLTLQALTNLQIKSIGYTLKSDAFFLLSVPKLTEMAFFVSMIYFMLATEIRFSQNDLNVNKLKIDQKYKKLSRDERMLKCKMIHMKAIQIAGKFLPQKNEFFTHILNRFNKNYKCVMEEINEQSCEQSVKDFQGQSIIKAVQSNTCVVPQDQYGISRSESLVNSVNLMRIQESDGNSPKNHMTEMGNSSPILWSMNENKHVDNNEQKLGKLKKLVKMKKSTNYDEINEAESRKKYVNQLRRKLSASKQKQISHNFQNQNTKSRRSQSISNQSCKKKRSLSSQQKNQRSNTSNKLIQSQKMEQTIKKNKISQEKSKRAQRLKTTCTFETKENGAFRIQEKNNILKKHRQYEQKLMGALKQQQHQETGYENQKEKQKQTEKKKIIIDKNKLRQPITSPASKVQKQERKLSIGNKTKLQNSLKYEQHLIKSPRLNNNNPYHIQSPNIKIISHNNNNSQSTSKSKKSLHHVISPTNLHTKIHKTNSNN